MRWTGRRESDQVEDRRGMGMRGGGLALGGGGLVLLLLVSVLTGQNPLDLIEVVSTAPPVTDGGGQAEPANDPQSRFVRVVLADTEDTWRRVFSEMGREYALPRLVLFTDQVQSACGFQSAAVGPFYCPLDSRVYLDLGFFAELDRRFGAPGDFAQAYVIAHEIGHHVQKLLGISDAIHRARSRLSPEQGNALSVRLELQADCLAGVWGHHSSRDRELLEPGDVEEGLAAAAAIGDDRLQRRASGTVQPESWTHGSSEQRVQWLRRGLESGNPKQCDTFEGNL